MESSLINAGMAVINPSCNSIPEKTVIVVGGERSGTSMVAGALKSLGIFLGDSHDQAVFEDTRIFKTLEGNDLEAFSKLVETYNSKYAIWGWKRPKSFAYANKFTDRVRNPHFIVTFRDSFSIAMRNMISVQADLKHNLLNTAKRNEQLIKFVITCNLPMLCVSYEKAISNKENFINSLIDYLNI